MAHVLVHFKELRLYLQDNNDHRFYRLLYWLILKCFMKPPNVKCFLCVCVGMFKQGCSAFRVVTPNIDEEASMMEDVGMQDVHFNEVDICLKVLDSF